MANLFDRLNKELEDFGKKAQSAFDEGRVRLDLMRLRRKQDNTARDLGLLYHQQERGGEADKEQIETMLTRLDTLKTEINGFEEEIRNARASATVNDQPAPDVPTGEAEVIVEEEVEVTEEPKVTEEPEVEEKASTTAKDKES
jgi:hypothetical protein